MPTAQSIPDAELLRAYIDERSSTAFSELAQRYLPLIYSSALRQTRDPHLAEDVSQAVLIVLSQKAKSIDPAFLSGWLIKTTHFAAKDALRKRYRQRVREEYAASMKNETFIDDHPQAHAISSEIDFALARLGEMDRTLVIQRFFQNKSFSEIAAAFASTEAAIQRRTVRALDKLRAILSRRGMTIAPAALPVALFAQKLHSPPAALSQNLTTTAAANASASVIAKSTLTTIAFAKAKLAAAILIPILILGAAVPAVHYATTRPSFPSAPISGSLPPGVTANIVAIKHFPDGNWVVPTGPDAQPLPFDADPLIQERLKYFKDPRLAVIIRLTSDKRAADTALSWPHVGGLSYIIPPEHADYSIFLLKPESGQREVTFSVAAASGPWTILPILPTSKMPVAISAIPGRKISFDPPAEKDHRAQITMRGNNGDFDWSLTALDKAGSTLSFDESTGRNEGSTFVLTYTFEKPLSEIQQFTYKSRPYNYHAQFAPIPF